MTRTAKKRRAAGTEATRRWRERRAQGRRLVTIEVADATLERLSEEGLLSITALEDTGALATCLSRILDTTTIFSGPVSDHQGGGNQPGQGKDARDAVAENAGAKGCATVLAPVQVHLQEQVRDGRGRWVRGVSGNPAGKKPGTRNSSKAIEEWLTSLL
ncbi:MAG: hypothetical protein WAS21_01095 [Geminicoccaceae bacterium]